MAANPTVEEVVKGRRSSGLATILAISTANPSNCIAQVDFPDYYFKVTNSEHMTELKEKFKRICKKTMIKKRHMHLTEEHLKKNPNMCTHTARSLNARQDMVVDEVPKLGKEAAGKAIKEWGQPKSKITHLVFCTTSGVDMPSADYRLARLLGLDPSVKRYMMYLQVRWDPDAVVAGSKGAQYRGIAAELSNKYLGEGFLKMEAVHSQLQLSIKYFPQNVTFLHSTVAQPLEGIKNKPGNF